MGGILILIGLGWVVYMVLNRASIRYNLPSSERRRLNKDYTQRPHWHREVGPDGTHQW